MLTQNATVRNAIGLYARPATDFVLKANSYQSSIWVEFGDRRVNAKSLLGVLSLKITKDMTVGIVADGPDEAEAMNALCTFLETE